MTYHSLRSSSRILAAAAAAAASVALLATPAAAQDPDTGELLAPPHLSVVDGPAHFDRDGVLVPAEAGQILTAGDRMTTRAGRLEILFGDGTALHLDQNSTIDLLEEDLIRLVEGRVYLHLAPSDPPFEYRIDTPSASVRTAVAGEYRISAGPITELAVARGFASIATTTGSLTLRSGEFIQVREGQPLGYTLPFNAAAWDPFDRWSQDRRRPRVTTVSSAPLQGPLTAYNATLSRHGTWGPHADYGQVWYPHVPAGWRPFYNGRWSTIAPYGWTWIGSDAWAWPTHYYGNWGVTTAGAWFWIPGVRWRPAHVHWTVTNAHVGWIPWGVSVDVFGFGFTAVPRNVFAVNVVVPRHVVRVSHRSLRPLVVAVAPPLPRNVVVRRAFGSARRNVFVSQVDSRGRQVRDPGPRVAQPRRGPSALVRAAVGPRSSLEQGRQQVDVRDEPRTGRPDIERRALDRTPDRASAPVSAERQQAPLREQPPLRSHGGAVASGGAEWRMPRRESREDDGGRTAAPRREPPRIDTPPPVERRNESRSEPAPRQAPREERSAPREERSAPRDADRSERSSGARQRWPN